MSKRNREFGGADETTAEELSGSRLEVPGSAPIVPSETPAEDAEAAASAPPPTPPTETISTPIPQLATGTFVAGAASAADIKTAQERQGGEAPRAAPKAGEGRNATAREIRHPELEPPPPPTELRVAPSAPTELERPSFGSTKPTLEELRKATLLELQTVDELSAGEYAAGVMVGRTPTEVSVASIELRGPAYLRALITDPRIEVRIKQ